MGKVIDGQFYPETDAEFVAFSHGHEAGRQRGLEEGVSASISRVSWLGVNAEGKDETELKFRTFEQAVTALMHLKDQVLTRRGQMNEGSE